MSLNKYSKVVTQDPTQPAAKAMLHAIGLSNDDLCKPFVGIASTGYEGNPCNMHLNDLSKNIKNGINKIHMPADGSVYFLNTGLTHWAENNGTEGRTHLVISLNGQDDL